MASVITPTANITKSIRSWWGKAAPYAQGGHPLTALAWALEVTLGGAAKDIAGSTIKSDWTGPPNATAKVDHKHLRRTIYIHVMACLLLILALMSAYLWAGLLL
jgi:cobalamin biosynthesis protein CobD/CbiB